jgi:hypothetical protein
MDILLPKAVTAEMFAEGTTIPEIDTTVGEVAWSEAEPYVQKARCIDAGWWYGCVKNVAAGGPRPSSAAGKEFWEQDETAPSNRTAAFDKYLYTATRRPGGFTIVLSSGFITGLTIREMAADRLQISCIAGVGGANLCEPVDIDLWEQADGLWEYLYGDLQRETGVDLRGIELHPDALITITLTRNNPAEEASVGFISVGQWQHFNAPEDEETGGDGGTEFGADASVRSFGYYEERKDGSWTRTEGRKATDITGTCSIAVGDANRARRLLERVADVPVAFSPSPLPDYSFLSSVGFLSGVVRSKSPREALFIYKLKGNP